jgi:hypothetical protein
VKLTMVKVKKARQLRFLEISWDRNAMPAAPPAERRRVTPQVWSGWRSQQEGMART